MIESEVAPPVIEAAKPASSDLAPGGLRAPQPVAPKGAARAWLPLVALLAVVMSLHLATLLRFPAPFVDEGWNASRAWGLLHTGQAFGTLDSGVFEHYDGYWTYFPFLATAVHTLFMAVLGPTLLSLRLASLLFGALLLLAIYGIVARLYGPRAGLIAAALLAVSSSFFFSAHMARHDIVVAAMGYGAVALYLAGNREGPVRFPARDLLCGLLVALTLDVHFNGAIFGPALLALYLLDHGRRVLLSRRFWGFAAGAAAGVAYFVAMHILPFPQTYFALASLGNGSRVTPPLFTPDPVLWFQSLQGTLLLTGLAASILLLAALALLGRRRTEADKRVLVLFAVLFLGFAALTRNKMPWYGIVFVPATCLVIAPFLDTLLRLPSRGSLAAMLRTALAAGAVGAYLLSGLLPLRENGQGDYEAAIALVQRTVPAGAVVMGTQTYWFALPGQTYYSWDQLANYHRYAPNSTLPDAFRALRPDYFVADGWLDLFVTDDPARLANLRSDTLLSKAELEAFLTGRAKRVAYLGTNTFGGIRIYRIDWSR